MRCTGNFYRKEETFQIVIKRFNIISQAFAAPADEPSHVANATVAEAAPVAPADKNATETTDKNSTEIVEPKEVSVQVTIIEEDDPNEHDIDEKDDIATDGEEGTPKPCSFSEVLRRLLAFVCHVKDRVFSGRKGVKENPEEETKISSEDRIRLMKDTEEIDNKTKTAAAPAVTVAPVEVTRLPSAQSLREDIHEKIAEKAETCKAPVLPAASVPAAPTPAIAA